MTSPAGPKVVLITGASGGLGRALARLWLDRGAIVAGLDRDASGFAALAGAAGTGIVDPYAVDITDAEAVDRTVAAVLRCHGRLDVVVNNAGITQLAAFAETAPAVLRTVMEVNFFGAVNVTRAALPALRASRGSLVAISSVAGFAPLVRRTAYAASKHAMQGFFGSLRAEEAQHGVHVLIACPSFIATNPGAAAAPDGTRRPGAAEDGIAAMPAEDAARSIVRAIDRRRDFVAVGRVAHMAWWLSRLAPSAYARLMRRAIRRR